MTDMKEPISRTIWDIKYRYKLDGKNIDQNLPDTWQRVAKAVAKAEKTDAQGHWENEFYRILEDFRFLPGGRILAGAGTSHQVTLFNCFVMDIRSDSLPGIFHALEEGALTLQQGGGVGYDFSVLRPKGDLIKKTGMTSSGPISFMKIWDTMCGILLSTGVRRGAMMGVMRCDHPDIEAFIEAKKDPHELRHFNVSVMVTDAFMKAVEEDANWPLVFQTTVPYRYVKARELWHKMIRSAYDYAEPGVLFGDTINRMNNLWYCEKITATNPCGEIPLPPYGACDLGAINLTQFVIAPFSPRAAFNWTGMDETVKVATRFLDNVIDISKYPLTSQHQQAQDTRRIGLGVTGLADVFVLMGMRYGDAASLTLARDIIKRIAEVTWQTSIELAQEKGTFPLYRPDYLRGAFVQTLDVSIQSALARHGVRNSHHNTIAPTGTTSLLANNVSNGIEPIFRADYIRHMHTAEVQSLAFQVKDYAYHYWLHKQNNASLPPAWVDVTALTPDAHLNMQGTMQPYIDNAISKTINIPADFPFANLADVYTKAYALGLKGCTIFRPNPITGAVLEEKKKDDEIVEPCCQHD